MRKVLPLQKQFEIIDSCTKARLNTIIPEIMEEYGFDMWVILCREYNEDPIYLTMVPCLCQSARRLSCLVFTIQNGEFKKYNFGRADKRIEQFYQRGHTDSNLTQLEALAQLITKNNPKKIGINTSLVSGMGDGLSHNLYKDLCEVLTAEQVEKLTSAYDLSTRWIETRTPMELSFYKTIYALAMDICEEAFSTSVIIPGITTTTEVEQWIMQEINNLGLSFWFSPHVDLQRKGLEGTAHTDMVIQKGDLLHYDVGLKYLGLCTDCQRLGYVLKDDELEIPQYILSAFKKTTDFQDIVASQHIIAKSGNEILKNSLQIAQEKGIKAMLYNHPIGFFGHSAGTVVGLWDSQNGIGLKGDFPLHLNTCYALELNTESQLEEWDGQTVRFSAEETVSFTENGKLNFMYKNRDRIFTI